ncbi:MAG: protein kinase [Thermoplasmatales archaeon]
MIESIGRYKLDSIIGRGAMGLVYKGKDPDIGRPVAIKVLNINSKSIKFTKESALEAFKREAKAAGSLVHPNIVTIYEVNFEQDPPYIVMQYIEGVAVSKLVSQGKLKDVEVCVSILRQVADGLDYAHSHNIFHRDIKPSNLLYTQDGKAYILDFGVAAVGILQTSKYIVGTVGYMSPEQMMNLPVGPESDQFNLAVTAYEILTGKRPFKSTEIRDALKEVASCSFESVASINSSLGEGVNDVIRKALSYDPADRFSSCSEFVAALSSELKSGYNFVSKKFDANIDISKILEEERIALLKELGVFEEVKRPFQAHATISILVILFASIVAISILVFKLPFTAQGSAPTLPPVEIEFDLHSKTSDEIVRAITDPNQPAEVIINAIREGVLRNPTEITRALTVASIHPNRDVRLAAVNALGLVKDSAAVDTLLYKLSDSDSEIRLAAVEGLSMHKDTKIIGFLKHVLKVEGDPRVRAKVNELLEKLQN